MTAHLFALTSVIVLAFGISADQPAPITVAMEDCKAERPGSLSGTSILSLLFGGGRKNEPLVKRGTVEVDGQKWNFYLPKAKSYPLVNKNPGDPLDNTSTLISIDQNGDGKLTDEEGWYVDMPLRFGDKMFEVTEIADDGSKVVLKPSSAPLRGAVVGRACPAFSFKTADGQVVSNETFAGKTLILDIWSFT